MPDVSLAHPFLKRLPQFQTPTSWRRLARNPSYLAPRVEDVQSPPPFVPPAAPKLTPAEQQLLAQILADPCDDQLRIAFAEKNKHHCDFIRTQLAIARELRAGDLPPAELLDREAELLLIEEPFWLEQLKPWGAKNLVFRRGFVERLSLTGRSFIQLGETLFDFLPLHGVKFVAVKWFFKELSECPHLAGLFKIDLAGNQIGDDGLLRVLNSKFFKAKRLNIAMNDVSDESISLLPPDIEHLNFSQNRLTRFDLNRFPALTSLHLSGNQNVKLVGPFKLQNLHLSECGLTATEIKNWCSESIRECDLSFNQIGDADVEPLLIRMPNVRNFSLRGNRLTAAAVLNFDHSLIRSLDFGVNFLTDAAVDHFTPSSFPELSSLDLTNTLLSDSGIARLCDSGILNQLHSLNLSWNAISDVGAKRLASCKDCQQLRKMDLSGTRINRSGIRALQESPHFPKLRQLLLPSPCR